MSIDIKENKFIDYVEEYLPQQFDKSVNTKALLEIFLSEDQIFQDELRKLFEVGLDLESATGYQLDILGKLSGLERTDDDDNVYREDIKFKQNVDNSSGTIPEVVNFARGITNIDNISILSNYPAAFMAQIDGGTSVPLTIADKVDGISGAGINAHSVIHLENGYGIVPCESDNYLYNFNPSTNQFNEILEGSSNWRSVLPEVDEVYDLALTSAGEPTMHAGESLALAGGYTPKQAFIKKGRVSETYTTKNYV